LDFFAKHWGDLAGVLGLALTVWFAFQAKTAAEQARDAAEAARSRIFSLDTVSELSAARMALGEIVRLQRLNPNIPWEVVLERYATARVGLVRCELGAGVPEAQRKSIRKALALLGIMVVDIDAARISEELGRLDTVRLNHHLANQIEELERARIAIEKAET
jgi:hypothetical protein